MAHIGEDIEAALLLQRKTGHGGIGGGTTITIDPRIHTGTETVKSADATTIDMSLLEQNTGVESDHIRDLAADLHAKTATLVVTAANDVPTGPNPSLVPARLAHTKTGRTDNLIDTKIHPLANDIHLLNRLPVNAITSNTCQLPESAVKYWTIRTL